MQIGDKVLIRGTVDEIRKDVVIIKNEGGYFGTVPSEIIAELPKGHGRLIDADALEYWKNNRPDEIGYHFVPKYEIDNAPTIIEADEEVEDGNDT